MQARGSTSTTVRPVAERPRRTGPRRRACRQDHLGPHFVDDTPMQARGCATSFRYYGFSGPSTSRRAPPRAATTGIALVERHRDGATTGATTGAEPGVAAGSTPPRRADEEEGCGPASGCKTAARHRAQGPVRYVHHQQNARARLANRLGGSASRADHRPYADSSRAFSDSNNEASEDGVAVVVLTQNRVHLVQRCMENMLSKASSKTPRDHDTGTTAATNGTRDSLFDSLERPAP